MLRAVCVVAVSLAWSSVATAQVAPREAGKTFQKSCISCHQPPDLSLATDRAWLDQLNRTA